MPVQTKDPFILASASPRRIDLLRQLGLTFTIVPSGADETFLAGETPEAHVLRLSELKAATVADGHRKAWVLGADTTVVVDGAILGKPLSPEDAGRMLRCLSDREHVVFTGFCLIRRESGVLYREAVRSSVRFRRITDAELAWYLCSPEPYDKAGAYAVQGLGAFFIREIHGSYTNVMGLPLCEVVDALQNRGALSFTANPPAVGSRCILP